MLVKTVMDDMHSSYTIIPICCCGGFVDGGDPATGIN